MKSFKLALSFMTILPVRLTESLQPGDLGRAGAWFPLVGLILGGLLALARWGLGLILPAPLDAVLVITLWAGLTGGLHLDGLADCCDGLLAALPPERRLEIMKDPRLGTFGGAGLLLHLLLKIFALAAIATAPSALTQGPLSPLLPLPLPLLALLLAPVLARWLILISARQPMARPGGLGVEFALGLRPPAFFSAALLPLVLVVLCGWRGLLAALLAHLAVWGVFRLARARLGGVTGDVLGLTVELGELAVLLAFAVRFAAGFPWS